MSEPTTNLPTAGASGRIRQLAAVDARVETGPVQFGSDWPGVFVRGDFAFYLSGQLRTAARTIASGGQAAALGPLLAADLRRLADLFASSDLTGLSRELSQQPASAAVPGGAPSVHMEFAEFADFVTVQNKEQAVPWPIAEMFVRKMRAALAAMPMPPAPAPQSQQDDSAPQDPARQAGSERAR